MTPAPERPKPASHDMGPEGINRLLVSGHSIVVEMTIEHGA